MWKWCGPDKKALRSEQGEDVEAQRQGSGNNSMNGDGEDNVAAGLGRTSSRFPDAATTERVASDNDDDLESPTTPPPPYDCTVLRAPEPALLSSSCR